MSKMAIQTKQQKRAEFALKSLEKFEGKEVPKDHAQFIVGVPTMILTNGLGQTLAFLKAKSAKKKERGFVYETMKAYLIKEFPVFSACKDDVDFLKKLNESSQADYIRMQRESLLMLEWLKRYARAFEQKTEE